MNTTTREPQAPESYATFWEPLAPAAAPPVLVPPEAKAAEGAPLELTEPAEGVPAAPRRERV